jgi:hypothetical protein
MSMPPPPAPQPPNTVRMSMPYTISKFGNASGGNKWMIVLLIVMILIFTGMFLTKKKFSFGRRR